MRLAVALVLLFPVAVTADAAPVSVDLFGSWMDPIANGNIRRLDATLKFSPRLRPGIGLTIFLGHQAALSVTDSRGTIPVTLQDGEAVPARSKMSLEYRDAIAKRLFGRSNLQGYAGLGLALPAIHRLQPVTSGNLTLFRASSPDHAALIVNAGAAYAIARHVRLFADLKYEPFASTGEVRRIQDPLEDLESGFHLLILSTGLSLRF